MDFIKSNCVFTLRGVTLEDVACQSVTKESFIGEMTYTDCRITVLHADKSTKSEYVVFNPSDDEVDELKQLVGLPVVISGKLKLSPYTSKDGKQRLSYWPVAQSVLLDIE